jgi:acetyl-CoA C-acetyltransferase
MRKKGELRVALVGAGMIRFGELFEQSFDDMVVEAYRDCLNSVDKGIDEDEIEAAWLGTCQGSLLRREIVAGFTLSEPLGLLLKPVTRVENACCSGSDAIRNAAFAVAAGIYETVLVVGAEKMRDVPTRASLVANRGITSHLWMHPRGATAPQVFGQNVTAHMAKFGTKREHFAKVAVKNHLYGSMNEKSALKFEVTLEQVLNAPLVSWPLGLFDCCPTTDGAAAVILTTEENAKRYTDNPVFLVGTGISADVFGSFWKKSFTNWPATQQAAKEAYKMAGITPKDIDVAELHDCFSSTELITYEDVGFCEQGKAGPWIDSGGPYLEGEIPCNLSGGLKSKGHPVGATGVAQAHEIFNQLRGKKGKTQLKNPRYGLTHNLGGTGSVANVNIYGL